MDGISHMPVPSDKAVIELSFKTTTTNNKKQEKEK